MQVAVEGQRIRFQSEPEHWVQPPPEWRVVKGSAQQQAQQGFHAPQQATAQAVLKVVRRHFN
jgi:hypothetical protein